VETFESYAKERVEEIKFKDVVWKHAIALIETWANAGSLRRPLSRAYELLHPDNVRQAIVQCCIDYTRRAGIGTSTILAPMDERQLARLFYKGAIAMPELPKLTPTFEFVDVGSFAAWRVHRLGSRKR
jgi:hypothetical protein